MTDQQELIYQVIIAELRDQLEILKKGLSND